jgi:hypothetical protein
MYGYPVHAVRNPACVVWRWHLEVALSILEILLEADWRLEIVDLKLQYIATNHSSGLSGSQW